MKNSILNLGKILNKSEQKSIKGGGPSALIPIEDCLNGRATASGDCPGFSDNGPEK